MKNDGDGVVVDAEEKGEMMTFLTRKGEPATGSSLRMEEALRIAAEKEEAGKEDGEERLLKGMDRRLLSREWTRSGRRTRGTKNIRMGPV
jgi:hypothetical protein